ncbi:T9SS type A sorting domain-containing protein [Algibacter miyuki]|uniref:T9SS type A sorting domain-containing protein n=1 Tax=Algibacter miyuki TaxID=1306933 RepID=A0ABV5H2U5_9FLAO|nr:T9SS type A sorting domain-containing protein [Algibacter miyuki]MDN3663907.1 T9SS type A sorting domain-containing protein [Algibacter miyuki]
MIKKNYLTAIFLFIGMASINAQSLWYENSSNTTHIQVSNISRGVFTTDETNPDTNGVNANTTVSKFVRDGQKSPTLRFNLSNPITNLSTFTISLKAYTSIKTGDLNTQNKRIRMYLRNASIGASSAFFEQLGFSEGETWESFSFNFDGIEIPENVALAGGYDQVMIGLATGDATGLTSTYYLDAISGTSDQVIAKADFLSGSWGVRFNLPGGYNLDDDSNYNWVAGAQEIVDNLPAVGHVITNFTHPAHGYYYTLRTNPYIDIANDIHPAMVPTLENEQIILDIIDVFRNSGKKVILYVNGGGPSNIQGASDAIEAAISVAWEAYCDANFGGDQGLGWRTLARGFFERFKGLVDGYWVDNLSSLSNAEVVDFLAMIRDVDPDIAIASNLDKSYIEDESGTRILVDSDGTNDADPTDYKVFFLEANDPYMDFTAGHPTPLGQGAPPNSWAYEEFSFPLITENPWSSYDGTKQTLKHYFAPIRQQWSVARADLIFEVEQAYRFVRTFTDAGAAITWSTTITDGFITDDEMAIMQEINNRMQQLPKPDFIPYTRPEGAYLVDETLNISSSNLAYNEFNLFPNPVSDSFILSTEIASGSIYNLSGQKIIEFKENQTFFDVSLLNDGIYVFRAISKNGESQVLKFIKQ